MTLTITDWHASWDTRAPEALTRPVVLLLHGFGSHESHLAGVGRHLPDDVAWAALRAPLAMGAEQFAWFPISTPGTPDPAPVALATAALEEWVATYVPASVPVVPVGFSQGGLMASQLLRTDPERYVAAGLLGSFVLQGEQSGDATLRRTRPPVFSARGDADTVIAPHAVARTEEWLPGHATATERTYAGLGHTISRTEAQDLGVFVADVLGLAADAQ